jgi:hypothetical protein
VSSPPDGPVVAESHSAGDGQFVLTLPPAEHREARRPRPVLVIVTDTHGTIVGRSELGVTPGESQVLTLDIPVVRLLTPAYQPVEAPPLVNRHAAAFLREKVRGFVARGELVPGAAGALDGALLTLEWLAALLPDAQGTLQGDPAAAERLRAALLGWSAEIPADEPTDDWTDPPAPPAEAGVVDPDGVLPMALAALHAATEPREAQLMLNGLAAALWARPWLELVHAASHHDDAAPMRTMMGAMPGVPGLPGGGRPGGVPRGPGPLDDGGIGLPGWARVPGRKTRLPIRVSPTVGDLVPYFRSPLTQTPSAEERCLVAALAQVYQLEQSLPRYAIRSLAPPDACAGQMLTLNGENFGLSGLVQFPGGGPAVAADSWSDTSIRVRVPVGAAPGRITLSILETQLRLCGKDFSVYRLGQTLEPFTGGVPRIESLWVNNAQGDTSAEPGSQVDVWFVTTQADGVSATLTVTDPAGAVVFQTSPLPGGTQTLQFTAPPAPTEPIDLRVTLRAQGGCEAAEQTIQLVVTYQPDLRIMEMEVTQGIQRLDNSVRLAANRRTLVRLYLTNGLDKFGLFSYTANRNELPGVTGSITLWRGSQNLATVSPSPAVPFTSKFFFQPGGRLNPAATLNFVLPSEHLAGPIRLAARVWLAEPPHGVLDGPPTTDVRSVNVSFEATNHVRLVQVRLRDDSRMLPAPTDAQFSSALQGARSRLPFPDDGFEIFLPAGGPELGVNRDLTTEDGWDFVLEDLDDLADDTADGWNYAWVGIITGDQPGQPALKLNGIGRAGNGEHDYPAMACQARKPATFAHELVHVFGYGHAGCPASGPDVPQNIDASLPQYIEDYAVDVYTLATFAAGLGGAGELMSYCGGPNRWTSIVLWHKLMDLLRV